ncbi:MAG: STAS domain-containing protein [Bacteroidota bacterium]
MFDIRMKDHDEVALSGRFDAAQVEKARSVFDQLTTTTVVDFKELDYISSAGLGVLMATQKRLKDAGHKLRLKNVTGHIRDVFNIARFDLIFDIE